MKKAVTLIALFTLCCVVVSCLTSGGTLAYAASDMSYTFEWEGEQLRVNNIVDAQGNLIGLYFGGYYFGESGIAVSVRVYGSEEMELNFAVGSDNLTDGQIAIRNKMTALFGEIHTFINRVDSLANTTYDGSSYPNGTSLPVSDVYRYNQAKQGDKIALSKDSYNMLLAAREMYNATDGAFNPAVYRLVDLWGFSSRIYSQGKFGLPYDRKVEADYFAQYGYPLPDEKYVEAFSAPSFTDFSDSAVTLSQEGGDFYVTKNVAPAVVDGVEYQQWIDLGGIAKGYAVDGIREMLAQNGIDKFSVDGGSSSMAYGWDYNGGNNVLAMADSFDPMSVIFPEALFSTEVGRCSVSTSGQNVRKYVTDGVEYSHIIDGVSGEPAQTGVRSVMVIVPEEAGLDWATKGDCLTTALTVMGRDKIVDFVNGYLKDNNIGIVVQYKALDGSKQLLSNLDRSKLKSLSDSFDEFGWALKQNDDGVFVYDAQTNFRNPANVYGILLTVLGCLLGAACVALIIYHFVKGRNRTLSNVRNAKKDKPFKIGDLLVYLAVILVIAVLFVVFVFDSDGNQIQTVNAVDDQTGETLFTYNLQRNEYTVNDSNSGGWTVQVTTLPNGVSVRLSKTVNGDEHFNEFTVTRGRNASVKMTDSLCGFHRDCVQTFPAITRSGGAIVCSPNRLKVVTL